MPRLPYILPAAAAALAAFAAPAGAESFDCSYVRACTPDGTCAAHEVSLTLTAPLMTVENEIGANDGANQTPGEISESGPMGGDDGRYFGVPQRGSVDWGSQSIEIFEPARDREDSTRAFMSLGNSDYVLTLLPDLETELAYFVNAELVSTLSGTCSPLDDDDYDYDDDEEDDDDA